MKVSLYMAVSIDGFIATLDHSTDWVSDNDWEVFGNKVQEAGCIVMGRKTMETSGEDFPYEGAVNIVLTKRPELLRESDQVVITNKTPREVINWVEKKGFSEVLIIGGGITNSSFLREGLIDEIVISIHPIILGSGIKLFEDFEGQVKLEKIEVKEAHELVWIKYRVVKD